MKKIYVLDEDWSTYYAPVVDFENESGLTGLSTRWKMPQGLSHAEAEASYYSSIMTVYDAEVSGFIFP
ncbi:MAG: hypothetical protein PHE27_02260 [Alphaproteobacteria bacterium]|nr:hypothetical protein [Alphaproteobacteria bacterium]